MRLRTLSACVFLAAMLAAPSARAQMSDGERKAAARAAYGEGVDLQDKGKPADALGRFEAAEKLFDAPTHLLRIAQCQALTGKLVEASETYETLSRKTLPAGSPDAFVQAQEQGKAELTALHPRIPTIRVLIKPEPQKLQGLQITVNDKQMPAELVGIARPVNPGTYRLAASARGWATAAPTTIDMPEAEAKTVELTLQEGATPIAVVPPVTTPATPPPYEEAQGKPPAPGPSASGLLVGGRLGIVVPGGSVDKNTRFENFATAGPGFGVDLLARLAKIVLLGGTLEVASLGAPDPKTFPTGSRAQVGTSSVYLGLVVGIIPRVDKLTFIGDLGLGFRVLDQNLTLTDAAGAQTKTETSYSGVEFAGNAGFSIPAGPIRFVPTAGVALGQFGSKTCTGSTDPTCLAATVDGATHAIFNVTLAIYYDVDLSKKSGAHAVTASRSAGSF